MSFVSSGRNYTLSRERRKHQLTRCAYRQNQRYVKLEVNLDAFIYRLFNKIFSSVIGTNTGTVLVPTIEEKSS